MYFRTKIRLQKKKIMFYNVQLLLRVLTLYAWSVLRVTVEPKRPKCLKSRICPNADVPYVFATRCKFVLTSKLLSFCFSAVPPQVFLLLLLYSARKLRPVAVPKNHLSIHTHTQCYAYTVLLSFDFSNNQLCCFPANRSRVCVRMSHPRTSSGFTRVTCVQFFSSFLRHIGLPGEWWAYSLRRATPFNSRISISTNIRKRFPG